MTTPTQAQIKAAAKAVAKVLGETHNNIVLAEVALNAAAQVGTPPTQTQIRAAARALQQEIEETLAAAQVGPVGSSGRIDAIDAALELYKNHRSTDVNATIERCAQVVERYRHAIPTWILEDMLTAIRKLKDEP